MNEQPGDRAGFGKIWLNRGIAAAKAGRRVEARDLLFRALNDESQHEMAWLWLAAVSDDPRQEQAYLEKVLELNPENRFAKAGLVTLEKRGLKDLPAPIPAPGTERVERPHDPDHAKPVTAAAPVQAPAIDGPAAEPAHGGVVSAPAAQATVPPDAEVAASELVEPATSAALAGSAAGELESFLENDESVAAPVAPVEGPREPTGWTTQTPLVEPLRAAPRRAAPHEPPRERVESAPVTRGEDVREMRPAPQEVRGEPRRAYGEYHDGRAAAYRGYDDRREVYAAAPPVRRQRPPRPRRREPEGRAVAILSEAFDDHEMWTVLASTVSLILLGLVMAFFFTIALTFGK